MAAALVSGLFVAAYVLPPVGMTDLHCRSPVRAGLVRAQSLYANDGGDSEVDWDKEAAALATPTNPFFKAVKAIPVPEMISEFADSAPPDVQEAVRYTIAKLLGNMPTEVAAITRVTSDKNIASLMFSMQMTGRTMTSSPDTLLAGPPAQRRECIRLIRGVWVVTRSWDLVQPCTV